MVEISDEQFRQIVASAIDEIPEKYQQHLDNMAFIIEDRPSPVQRKSLKLGHLETLFGLYEGVPLPARGGQTKLLPDKITIFKDPIRTASGNVNELKEIVRNTVWHEVAHFFGLDHLHIRELENRKKKSSDI